MGHRSSRLPGWRSPGSTITRWPRHSARCCGWSWCRWRWGGRHPAGGGGTAASGRRTALLAGLSAALGLFLIRVGVLVATGGGPYTLSQIREAGGTDVTSYFVGDGLGRPTMFLLLIPLLTATIGWAGAALAARIRRA